MINHFTNTEHKIQMWCSPANLPTVTGLILKNVNKIHFSTKRHTGLVLRNVNPFYTKYKSKNNPYSDLNYQTLQQKDTQVSYLEM